LHVVAVRLLATPCTQEGGVLGGGEAGGNGGSGGADGGNGGGTGGSDGGGVAGGGGEGEKMGHAQPSIAVFDAHVRAASLHSKHEQSYQPKPSGT